MINPVEERRVGLDYLEQLFWFDDLGRPAAAVIATDFGDATQLDPLVLSDATPDWINHVMQRDLDHASSSGFEAVMLEVDRRCRETPLPERGVRTRSRERHLRRPNEPKTCIAIPSWPPEQSAPRQLFISRRLEDRSPLVELLG